MYYKIGIIGDKYFSPKSKVIDFIYKLKNKYGSILTILSGGTEEGVESWVKKYSLECDFKFKEYNTSFSGYRMYSAMPESYYGKNFHPSHFPDRYKHLLYEAECLVIFIDKNVPIPKDILYAISLANKRKTPLSIIK